MYDGKPLYRRMLTTTITSSLFDVQHLIPQVDKIFVEMGWLYEDSIQARIPVGFYNGSEYFSAFTNATKLYVRASSSYTGKNIFVIVNYTKTTD